MDTNTLLLNKGYKPELSQGSVITPVFKSSTFCFPTAEDGEKSFQIMQGKIQSDDDPSLVYSRMNNPNMEITEEKLALFDKAEKSLLFSSGMAAISNTCLTFLEPGDTILYTNPVYGGTSAFFQNILKKYHINSVPFPCGLTDISILAELIMKHQNVKIIFIETPCNPHMILTSIKMIHYLREGINKDILIAVDNTMAGPIFLKPLQLGADLCLYSVTKFIGGHSDVVAGCVSGSKKLVNKIQGYRSTMGSILDPESCWLIQRSLITLDLRMNKQYENTKIILQSLENNKHITKIYYPGYELNKENKSIYTQKYILTNEYSGGSSVFSILINCDKDTIFKILNGVKLFKLAVSLGAVESLIQHPSSMTHSCMSEEDKQSSGIYDNLVRCSVGLENPYDLSEDLISTINKCCDSLKK